MMTLTSKEEVNKKSARYMIQTHMFCCGFFCFSTGRIHIIPAG